MKRKDSPLEYRGNVLARCVGCGAVGVVEPGERDQPMCGLCLMPMIATKACARHAKKKGKVRK